MKGSGVVKLLGGLAALLALAGCTYDYMQRTDKVSHRAGNAVETNMAIQTTNPSKDSQYDTRGLGKNGAVLSGAGTSGDTPDSE